MCLATAKGNKGRGNNEGTNIPNQDASVVIHGPLQSSQRRNGDEDDDTNVNRYRFVLAALFDGHGEWGHVASQIAVNDFPTRVLQKLREIKTPNPTTATRLIKNALLETDQIAMANMPHQAGSTAVVVFYLNHFVYISSLGDSTALLVQRVSSKSTSSPNHSRRHHNASSIRKPTPNFESSFLSWVLSVFWWYQLSPPMDIAKEESRTTMREPCEYKVIASAVRHKPGDPKERSRIERNGGTVYIPTNNKESSRVVFTLNDESTDSAMQMALAMSRSLGDEDAKELKLVTADASTVVVDLRDYYRTGEPNHFFVILASDGVMDEVETKTVVDTIGTALYAYETNNDDDDRRARRLYDACQDIVKQAVRGWSRSTGNRYRDDISLVVQKIEA